MTNIAIIDKEKVDDKAVAIRLTIEERVKHYNERLFYAKDVELKIKKYKLPYQLPYYAKAPTTTIKQDAWNSLFQKTGVRELMSIKRQNEVDELLHRSPEELPEFTEENIWSFIDSTFQSVPNMITESIREVYNWLMPSNWNKHKTNNPNKLGLKVILTCVAQNMFGTTLSLTYGRTKDYINALGNVLLMLDGKGVAKYPDTLENKIETVFRQGKIEYEDEYLHMKFFKNGNAHVTFKRQDLIDLMNQTATSGALPQNWKESRGFSH